MSLLKIYTCALCLGTVLGVSSMAMEQNGEECQQEVSEQVQILETNREKEEKSERCLKFYNDLIAKGKLEEAEARKQAEIFKRELNRGKSFIYAQYYSMLRVMRKLDAERAMFQSEVFEKEFRKNKDFRRADYYATIMISHNIKAMRFERFERRVRACKVDNESIEYTLKIVKKEIEANRSYFYIKRYINQLGKGYSELAARRDAGILEKEFMAGKSIDYAKAYANLKLMMQSEEKSRRGAEIVEKEEMEGRRFDYAMMYSTLILNGESEKNARKEAEIFDLEKESLRYEEDSNFRSLYIRFYLMVRTEWNQPKETAEEAARVIIGEIRAGRKELYAKTYAELVVIDKEEETIARRKAEIIYNATIKEKYYSYALKCAELTMKGMPEAEARIKAEALMKIK